MSRALLVGLVVVGVVIAGAVVLRSRNGSDVPVAAATVTRSPIERIVVASGTIEPEDLVEVRPKVSGIVKHFHVDAGDRVRAGQVVAELDRETLEAAVREARAIVREAEVDSAHTGLELRRRRQLVSRGVESQEQLDRMESENAAADARLERARATLERLEQELAYATITAPIDGVVLQRDLNAGAAAASVASVIGGTVLMVIADTAKMHLLGVIDENEIAQVRVGMPARIRTEAYADRVFPGRVSKIASIGDRKENITTFKVEVTVLEGVDALWPRLSADADIVTEVHAQALVAPETALVYDGTKIFVDVLPPSGDGNMVRRPVRLGISNGDRVELVDGVAEGERVKLQ
jgi:HlyD family secretion protein